MNRTILYFLAITACASAASIAVQGGANVALNSQAQEIVDAAKPFGDAKKIAKLVRIIAAQGPNSRTFVASLDGISAAAQTCAFAQAKIVGQKVQTKQMEPEAVNQAILDGCSQYKDELEPTLTAYKAAIPEITEGSGTFYSDMPASVQALVKAYVALSQEIQADPTLKDNKAVLGPKVQALIDQFKAIPEADRAAVGEKLPYTKEFLLPSGQYYADFNSMLDFIVAKANGQQYDTTALKSKAKTLEQYVISHSEEELNYLNNKIDAYVIPDSIAQDGQVNKVAAALGKTGANYAKMLFKQPQFNAVLNSLVNGNMDGQAQVAIAA